MKKKTALTIALFTALNASGQPGELDLSFNGDGKYLLDLTYGDRATTVALQPDEKILIGANIDDFSGSGLVLRLDRYGNPDLSFGILGEANLGFPEYNLEVRDLEVQDDGKILALTRAYHNSKYSMFLTRLNSQGITDLAFGDSGMVYKGNWYGSSYWNAVLAMPDGKIVVGGYANFSGLGLCGVLLGFNANGSANLAFGDSGMVKFNLNGGSVQIEKLLLNADGRIVVAGRGYAQGNSNLMVAQFNTDGSFYSNFGGNGISTIPFGYNMYGGNAAIQGDGKILVTGMLYADSRYQFALARLLPDGTLDQDFGSNGKVITPVLSGSASPVSVSVLGDGKILVAGEADGLWNKDFALLRYQADGALDKSFSIDGVATKNIGNGNDYANAAVLQPNGRIVIVGESYNNSSSSTIIAAARFLGGEGIVGFEEAPGEGVFSIYPNPASEKLHIRFSDTDPEATVEVYDRSGALLKVSRISGKENELDVSDLPGGVYVLTIKVEGNAIYYQKLSVVPR